MPNNRVECKEGQTVKIFEIFQITCLIQWVMTRILVGLAEKLHKFLWHSKRAVSWGDTI